MVVCGSIGTTTALWSTGGVLVAVVLGACVWVRRSSWRYRWDYALTLTAILDAVGLLMCLPVPGRYLDWALHYLTGVNNVNNYIGHLCFLSAIGWTIFALCCRLLPDDQLRREMRWVEIPGAAAAAAMLIALVCSHSPHTANFFSLPVNTWLRVYWLVFGSVVAYLLVWMGRMLLVMRTDPRSKVSATTSLIAVVLGIITVALRVTATVFPHTAPWATTWTWIFLCAAITSGTAGAAWSWVRGMHEAVTGSSVDQASN